MNTKTCPVCGKVVKSLGYMRHMAMHRDEVRISKDALKAGFEIVFNVKEYMANVIASGDYGESDTHNHELCKRFIKAYKKSMI